MASRTRIPVLPAVALVITALALAAPVPPLQAASVRGAFDRAPFYDGRSPAAARPASHVPVEFRHDPASLDPTPDRSPALAALLDSLRAELDRIGLTRALGDRRRVPGGPDVRFGVRRGGTGSDGIPLAPTEADTREPRKMAFEVEGPARPWRDHLRTAAGDSVRAVVTIQLGFDEYWVRQKDWKGGKQIELGTGRAMPVAWLTSLDDPVQVLQLTGALVTPDGKVTRVGAEGLIARRTGMAASALGAQEVLTEDDLAALSAPGPDGAPAWRSALRSLVEGLFANPRR